MRNPRLMLLPLLYALAMSACARRGDVKPPPLCPRLPTISAALMAPPTTAQKVRRELLAPPAPATRK